MKRVFCFFTAMATVLTLFTACHRSVTPLTQRSFTALDTLCEIAIYDRSDAALIDDCVTLVNARERLWSRTVTDSDVAAINTAAGNTVTIHTDTAALLRTASAYTALSDGAFDITAAPLSNAWAAAEATGVPPSEQELASLLAVVGTEMLTITDNTATLAHGGGIDLGGIAKGQIADDVVAHLRDQDCTSALVDLGGNIIAIGAKPDGTPFHIGIADPQSTGDIIATVAVTDRAVVTSGSYQRGFQIGDTHYSHILDPKTGRPVDNDLLSVTILAPHAVDADALSTACFVLGYDRAMTLLGELDDIDAVFVMKNGAVRQTGGVVYAAR